MDKVVLRDSSGYSAEVYTHGAHVTSWKNPAGEDLLFLSGKAIFKPPTAIRGGIPLCWPQFGDFGPCKAQHGFARNTTFQIINNTENSVTMELKGDSIDQFPDFPQLFTLRCKVTVGDGTLEQELQVQNPSNNDSLPFTAALHTYFRLQNGIEAATVHGMNGCRYLDSLQGRKEFVEESPDGVKFSGEVDRIYLQTPDTLKIADGPDGQGQRGFVIEKMGFADAVVWNPHVVKAAKMADFGDDEWKDMVCVEVAQAGSGKIDVPAGGTWVGRQKISLSNTSTS